MVEKSHDMCKNMHLLKALKKSSYIVGLVEDRKYVHW